MRDTVARSAVASAGRPAFAIALVGALAIATVWILEARGYVPCELCLKERIPYDLGIPLALVLGLAARRARPSTLKGGYLLLGLLFAAGALLGAYHTGVEWKLWAGPSECSGPVAAPAAVGDFLQQLQTVSVVRCDDAALRVLGLSLAAWNALLSAALAALAAWGWRGADAR